MGQIVALPHRRSRPPRRVAKLTKRSIEALKPDSSTDVWLWDLQLKGFGVRVRPSGARIYVVQYRNEAGRTRRLHLGRHGVLTAENAREVATQRLAAAHRGEDPAAERKRGRAEARHTVADLAKEFLAYIETRRKPSTLASYRRLVEKQIVPKFGTAPVTQLTHEALRDWHASLSETPTEANRALAVLSSMLGYARVANPCSGVGRYPEIERQRFYNEADLIALGKALGEAEHTATAHPAAIDAIRLLALSGCRLGEVLGLEWGHVDLDAGVLRLADAKAGARVVPLSDDCVALIRTLPKTSRFVIPGKAADEPFSKWSLEYFWTKIRDSAGLKDARIHDLRHTVGTSAGAAGLNAFAVRDLLGHKTLAMTGRYVSRDTNPMRKAANIAVAPIARALMGKGAPKRRTNRRKAKAS